MSEIFSSIGIIIPALNPDEKLIHFVENLSRSGFPNIILVDDGSDKDKRVIFDTCKTDGGCEVLRHATNLGKGMALKTAFNYILDKREDIKGVVTVDCDGQHSLPDTITCSKLVLENEDHFVLGCRTFNDKEIPFRSRFGNRATRIVIKLLCGISVSDTQTGLRGMSRKLLAEHFASTKGERFEYEMNQLIEAKECNIPIKEFPIQTIYLENNESSHFNPFIDSIRIYKVFLKFSLSSFSSFLLDIIIFYLFTKFMRGYARESVVLYSGHFVSKALSSIYNFTINKNQVFKNKGDTKPVLIRYYILWFCQTLLSAVLLVRVFKMLRFSVTALRIVIETLIYFISFQIQREWVFKKRQ